MNIIKLTSIHNTSYKKGRSKDWIVLHYTAGVSSKAGAARNVATQFKTSSREASADFIVDDAEIVQYNEDIDNRFCWSVGGAKYTSMSTSLGGKYYGKCTNSNSISIEMCSNKTNTGSLEVTDDDWYLTDATIANAIELTKYLMATYNIDADHVIMHHMVTGKWCPQPWTKNESALDGWNKFMNAIRGAETQPSATPSQPTVTPSAPAASIDTNVGTSTNLTVKVIVNDLNIRTVPSMSAKVVGTTGKGVFTIVKTQDGWGLLKSNAGWIYIDNPKYVTKMSGSPAPSAPAAAPASNEYQVKVKVNLNIRRGAGVKYGICGVITDKGVYTIVETKGNWGKLKSGKGWICLDYTTRV